MNTRATTWAAWIAAVLMLVTASGTASAFSVLLSPNSCLGKNALEGGFHRAAAAVSAETCRRCGDYSSCDAAGLFVAPKTWQDFLPEAQQRLAATRARLGDVDAYMMARPVTSRPAGLTPGQPLPDTEIVTMIGGNSPGKFKLNPQDLKPLPGVTAPGKSAGIAIDLTPGSEVAQAFGRPAQKGDIVIGASVKDIRAAGFDVVYAPTAENPLHVRIIERTGKFTDAGSEELSLAFDRLAKQK